MQLKTSITLSAGVYGVQIGLSDDVNALTPVEATAFAQFGEPVVETGGAVTAGETTVTLPSNPLRFPSQFPVKQVFAIADNANAGALATQYLANVQANIIAGRNTQIGFTATAVANNITTV